MFDTWWVSESNPLFNSDLYIFITRTRPNLTPWWMGFVKKLDQQLGYRSESSEMQIQLYLVAPLIIGHGLEHDIPTWHWHSMCCAISFPYLGIYGMHWCKNMSKIGMQPIQANFAPNNSLTNYVSWHVMQCMPTLKFMLLCAHFLGPYFHILKITFHDRLWLPLIWYI